MAATASGSSALRSMTLFDVFCISLSAAGAFLCAFLWTYRAPHDGTYSLKPLRVITENSGIYMVYISLATNYQI
jgi:hypothetical protein